MITLRHLLLPPLLLFFCYQCLTAVQENVDAENQHSIYKTQPRIQTMRSDVKVIKERSNEHFLIANSSRADFPCPESAAIAPCTCTVNSNNLISLDCTDVESVDQLVEVFQQDFPVKELYEFSMRNNNVINGFPGFMNGITFESVNLSPGPFTLAAISENFLFDMKDTLKYFSIYNSKLSTDFFPFFMLPLMNQLEDLQISTSDINRIPPIRAPKLDTFYLLGSSVERLVNGTFSIGTGPMTIWVDDNPINTIEVGSIFFADQNSADSNELIHIDGYNARLQSLKTGTFPLRNGPMSVHFLGNQISSIEPGAFVLPASTDRLTLGLNLATNQLTTIDEAVFRNLMPFTTQLILTGNPLTCGCDMAWLILDADFLATVDDGATCVDGTNLHDLDHQQYIDFC